MAGLLADLVLVVHLGFILFVVLGGLTVVWRRWMAWIHLPCAAWGAFVELAGWMCPLTPLENRLRNAAGEAAFSRGFIEHYLDPILYPSSWSRVHLWLGVAVVVVNAAVYLWALSRRPQDRDPVQDL